MLKCPKCKKDSATYRAEVRVCPQCHATLDAEQLLKLLKELEISDTVIEGIKAEILYSEL